MVRQSCTERLGVVSDHAKRLYLYHVPPELHPNALSVRAIMECLTEASASTFHEFWPDDLSLLDAKVADSARIHGPRQLTDLYLLALAVRHNGQFVTFDTSVSVDAIRSAGKKHILTL